MTRSSTKELITPFENPKRVFRSKRRLFETPGLVESSSPELDLFSDIKEHSKEEETTKIMTETMEQYMSKTRGNYGSGVARPKINDKTHFKLKGLDVPTRQILDSKGAIPTKTVVYAKVAIQEMVQYSQKWHNGTSSKSIRASVTVMPISTYINLGLGDLAHTRLTIELPDRTIKHPRSIAENVLVRIVKEKGDQDMKNLARTLIDIPIFVGNFSIISGFSITEDMDITSDIYAAGSENRPPMLNKDNYVTWSSRIIRYARSRPNGKMIVDSIENEPYTDIKRMDADDQALQTILLGLPKDIYATVDSCETAKEIWEHVRQMMKGSDIGEEEKKAKLFNEWEKFTSTDRESIESYYHRFMQLMNDLKRNKHFPKNIASNLKFLNNLQPKWKRHVTIVRQTKNLHEADFTQIYDFLKMNQDESSYNFPITYKDQSSSSTHSQQSFPINNKYNPQPSLNQNFMQPPVTSLADINDPIEAMNASLILFAKAFQLTTLTNNNQWTSSNPRNHQIAQPVMNMGQDRQIQNVRGNSGNQFGQYAGQVAQNQQGYNAWQNCRIQGTQNAGMRVMELRIKPGATITEDWVTLLGIALPDQGEGMLLIFRLGYSLLKRKKQGFNFKQKNLTSWLLQLDKAPVYDTDGSAE
nr:hypothetical protein [Tanacetum cinerariifolium]